MEIRNLPIPVNPNPVPVATRGAAFTPRQDNADEQSARPVNETEQVTQENNNEQQNIEANLQILLQAQQGEQQANGSLQDEQLGFSAQQAIEAYQDIDSQEENQADVQVLSRIDELV